jgi:hypothetical protein
MPLEAINMAIVHTEPARLLADEKRRTQRGVVPHMVNGELLDPHASNVMWVELSPEQQHEWEDLGWTQIAWDRDAIVPQTARTPWIKLSTKQRDAATRLGFTEKSWNNHTFEEAPGPHLGLVKGQKGSLENADAEGDQVNDDELGPDENSDTEPNQVNDDEPASEISGAEQFNDGVPDDGSTVQLGDDGFEGDGVGVSSTPSKGKLAAGDDFLSDEDETVKKKNEHESEPDEDESSGPAIGSGKEDKDTEFD